MIVPCVDGAVMVLMVTYDGDDDVRSCSLLESECHWQR